MKPADGSDSTPSSVTSLRFGLAKLCALLESLITMWSKLLTAGVFFFFLDFLLDGERVLTPSSLSEDSSLSSSFFFRRNSFPMDHFLSFFRSVSSGCAGRSTRRWTVAYSSV